MQILFKFQLFTLFLFCQFLFSQEANLVNEAFDTDKNTVLSINLNAEEVHIINSPDNKIYINYDIKFNETSKKRNRELLEKTKVDVSYKNGTVTIKNNNKAGYFSIVGMLYNRRNSNDKEQILKKSKQDILNEITELKSQKSSYLELINQLYKDDPSKLERFRKKHARFSKRRPNKNFVIQVPEYVKINFFGLGTKLNFDDDIKNEMSIRLKNGRLSGQKISNTNNTIKLNNSSVFINVLHGGKFSFDNVKYGLISEVINARIESEFSNIQIGEIGADNTINDFKSEFWFYNWAKDFGKFNLFSEYSKIHFYRPKLNYTTNIVGSNTKNIDSKMNSKPINTNETYTLTNLTVTNTSEHTNKIHLDISNGIFYTKENLVKRINK